MRKPKNQQELDIPKKGYPAPAAFAAAANLKEEILKRHPEDPCGVPAKWKRMNWPWATSFDTELKMGRDADRLVRMAGWAMDNGFTITGPKDIKAKEAAIIQRRKQIDAAPAPNKKEHKVL